MPRESSQLLYMMLLYIIRIRSSIFILLISIIQRNETHISVLLSHARSKPISFQIEVIIYIDRSMEKHFKVIACPFDNFIRNGERRKAYIGFQPPFTRVERPGLL